MEMNVPPPSPESDELYALVRTVLRLSRRLRQTLDDPLERALGLNTRELLVLSAIMDGYDTPGAVAERHNLPAPTVTRVVTKLVEGGLLSRENDPSDLRRQRLVLTPQGERTRSETRRRASATVQEHFGHLDPALVQATLSHLRALEGTLPVPTEKIPTEKNTPREVTA